MSVSNQSSHDSNPWANQGIFQLSSVDSSMVCPTILPVACKMMLDLGKIHIKDFVERLIQEKSLESLPWSLYTGLFGIDLVHYIICNNEVLSLLFPYKEVLTPFFQENMNWSRRRLGYDSEELAFACYLSTDFFGSSILLEHCEKIPLRIPKRLYESYRGQYCANELLYGRAGMISILSMLRENFHCSFSPPQLPDLILNAIPVNEFPWMWHDKVYFGAAHGTSGILLVLFRNYIECNLTASADDPEKSFLPVESNHIWHQLCSLLLNFLEISIVHDPHSEFINIASSQTTQQPGKLVQWCHGASGVVPLLCLVRSLLLRLSPSSSDSVSSLYQPVWTSSQQRLLNHIDNVLPSLLETVWRRGMCTTKLSSNQTIDKGGGLCHGLVSGAYACLCSFLHYSLHPHETSQMDSVLWRRTVAFLVQLFRRYGSNCGLNSVLTEECLSFFPINVTQWMDLQASFTTEISASGISSLQSIVSNTISNACAQNDHPLSLFEGISGVLLFIHDFNAVLTALVDLQTNSDYLERRRVFSKLSHRLVGGLGIY